MAVEIINLQTFTGVKPITRFTDNFTGGATNRGLGPNWLGLTAPLSAISPGHESIWLVPGPPGNNRARMTLFPGGAGGSPTGLIYAPWPIINPEVFGKTQYSQCNVTQFINGSGIIGGPAVACSVDPNSETAANAFSGVYNVSFDQSNALYRVFNWQGPDMHNNVVLLSADLPCAVGDILRISVQFNTPVANTNRIIVKRNGVQEFTVDDATVSNRPTTGFPGLYGWAGIGGGGGQMEITAFDCGLGL
jgi:hypothetical protein